jgi:hypothetical protein
MLHIMSAEAACPDPAESLEAAEASLLALSLDDVPPHLDAAERAWVCGAAAEAEEVARWWLARAAWQANVGESPDSAFLQAHHVAPDVWFEAYGPVLRAEYEHVVSDFETSGHTDHAQVTLHPLGADQRVMVDGATRVLDALPAGRRLIQVFSTEETARFSRFVRLQPLDKVQLETGMLVAEVADPVAIQAPGPTGTTGIVEPSQTLRRPKRPVAPLIVGLSAGALSAVAWGLAAHENAVMKRSEGDALDRAYQRHLAFSGTTVGLLAAGVTGLTLHFTL